jgi:hypothetical protein
MPFDFGDHPARLAPTDRLVGEVRVVSADLAGRPSDRSLEQIADAVLQDPVGWQPDRVLDPPSLQVLKLSSIQKGTARKASLPAVVGKTRRTE